MEREHGRQGASSRGDHLFHSILKYGLAPVKIKELASREAPLEDRALFRAGVKIDEIRNVRLVSERGERHRYVYSDVHLLENSR